MFSDRPTSARAAHPIIALTCTTNDRQRGTRSVGRVWRGVYPEDPDAVEIGTLVMSTRRLRG